MSKKVGILGCCLVALWALGSALAQGLVTPEHQGAVVIASQTVRTSIDGSLATTTVEQVFKNLTGSIQEGIYFFPIPADAALSDFVLIVNGQEVAGQVVEAGQARATYEEIVRRIRDPGLLEYVRDGLFQARIFPIMPNSEFPITLRYTQFVPYELGAYRYRYGLAVAAQAGGAIGKLDVRITIDAGQALGAVFSPSYPVTVERGDDGRVTVTYEAENITPERDLSLHYTLQEGQLGASLVAYSPGGEPGYFALLLSPGFAQEAAVLPKNFLFVLDTSGSMDGEKIMQARNALDYVLDTLNPDDTFNVIVFSSDVQTLFRAPQPVTDDTRAAGHRLVSRLVAEGGTNINEALLTALGMTSRLPDVVVFLTDGVPTVGEQDVGRILANIQTANQDEARIFTFGVGYDVNTFLLDELANDSGGLTTYVEPGEDIELAVSDLIKRINNPVLTDLALETAGVEVFDLFPRQVPDLYLGSQLVILGRFEGSGTLQVRITGQRPEGAVNFEYALAVEASSQNSELAYLWAQRKVAVLLDQIRRDGETQEIVDTIVQLGTRFGIVTPYTSFLAIPEGEGGFAEPLAPPDTSTSLGQRGRLSATAPSSRATTGAGAVAQSEELNRLRDADTLGDDERQSVKQAGGRTFVLKDGVWTDTEFTEGTVTVDLEFLSNAYFDFVIANSDAQELVSVGDQVIFLYQGVWYRITPAQA
ncbi:MAG: VWA domain-containing protein [Deinococcus sp.]|nr:VWA domain-containing protein [Deinococcus sp.]